jgi:spermidine synthase
MKFKNKHVKKIARTVSRQFEQLWSATFDAGKPYLTERDGVLALNFDAMSVQSEMYVDRPDELVISYTRAMMSFLLLNPAPRRIAMIGLGGGSIAKYCYRYLPAAEIKVIEISPEVIALRDAFLIPADDTRFCVLADDGARWVVDTTFQPEVLIVDGFDTEGLPAALRSQRFYDDCFVAVADSGMLVVNLWGGYPNYELYLARICNSFAGRVLVLDSDDGFNKIILAVKNGVFPPLRSSIKQHAATLDLTHALNFQVKSNRLIDALTVFAAGGR